MSCLTVSVVVPVYDGEETLRELVARLEPVLQSASKTFELILVNDCSSDSSWFLIEDLARDHPWVRGVDLATNAGQHEALLCGTRCALHDVIVTMDDDLQHAPEEVPALLAALKDGVDVVYGVAPEDARHPVRVLTSRAVRLSLQFLVGVEACRHGSALRAFRTRLRDTFASHSGPLVCLDVLLASASRKFALAEVRRGEQRVAPTTYNIPKLVWLVFAMLTSMRVMPRRMAGCAGAGVALAGAGAGLWCLLSRAGATAAPDRDPWSRWAAIALVTSGLAAFAVTLAAAIAPACWKRMGRAGYVIRRVTGAE